MTADTDLSPSDYIAPPTPPSLADMPLCMPDPSERPPVRYIVQLSTANAKWAGTDKDVYLQLVGDSYTTHFIHLIENSHTNMETSLRYSTPNNCNNTTASRTAFPMGSIREFRFNASPVGNLVKICVRLDTSDDASAAWKLERVVIRDESLHRSWTFLCSRWLNRDMGNQVDLKPSREVSAGRRASRRASRRLSAKHNRHSQAAEATVGFTHFEEIRDRFGSDDLSSSEHIVNEESEMGTRRVCFQLQKFTNKSCHLYLMGEIPALGGWKPENALRMTMQAAADGTWRGEWRLELEIDDDYDDIQYTYLIVNESDAKHSRRVDRPDRIRCFKLSAPDSVGRSTEGGRIHIRDSFGSNKFGLPSASAGSPSLVLKKPVSRTVSVQNSYGESSLVSRSVIPIVSTIEPSEIEESSSKNGLSSAVQGRGDTVTSQSTNFVKNDGISGDESKSDDVHTSLSQALNLDAIADEMDERSYRVIRGDGSDSEEKEPASPRNMEHNAISPEHDIRRVSEAARRQWEEQLDASDGQLLQSARRLFKRQSEVAYLKKRNSREASSTPFFLSPSPESPEKTSPISSDGILEEETFVTASTKQAVISLAHSEIRKPLIEERDNLLSQLETVQQEALRREGIFRHVSSTHRSLREELMMMREKMSEQCENHEAQQAELVRLVMDGQEAYRVSHQELTAERDSYLNRWAKEFKTRRKLFNTIQELRGNIRVFCRVRPLKESTVSSRPDTDLAVGFPDASVGENAKIQLGSKCFEFDHVFPPCTSQKDVYDETAGVVASVLDGYNVCVFAYGQTGSGKTHTMNGPNDDRGVNYRALVDLFAIAAQRSQFSDVTVSVSMLEIYNEQLRDLIRGDDGSNPTKLEIRKDPRSASPNAVHVPNLTEVKVDSVESVWEVMELGSSNRKKGKTNMNEHSSRSHLILRVAVSCKDLSSGVKSSGVLHLVDLAGSERVGRSNVSGDRLKEAQHINKSLATLGDVFMSLLSNSGHVPYRNSKLTYLLQDCLGGDSKTLMFVNVSADETDAAETVSSLQFAQRVAKIELGSARKHTENLAETKATVSLQVKEKEVYDLNAKVTSLQKELRKRNESIEECKERVRVLEKDLKTAQTRTEEQNRRENSSRESSAHGLKELQARLEKSQAEIRAAKQKMKEVGSSKDEEIIRLNALLKSKDKKIVELSRQSSKPGERPLAALSSRLTRPASSPVVGTRRSERAPLSNQPRGSATFAARSRHVRFESPPQESGATAGKEKEDSAAMPPPPTPASAGRRFPTSSLPRSQTMTGSNPQRQSSRGAVASATGKAVTYAFGTRVEASASESGTGHRPARNVKLPRAQTTLRPAQRVSQIANGRTGHTSLSGAGRAGSGLRRAGTISGVARTPSQGEPEK